MNRIDHDSVVRSFKKLGITTVLDGSEGHLVNIHKLPEYEMPTDYLEEEYDMVDSEDDLSDSSSYDITSSSESSSESDSSSDSDSEDN